MSDRYSRFEDAMVVQARQLQFLQTDTGLAYLEGFFEDMDRAHKPEHRRDPAILAGIQLNTLREAEPIYASIEACELVAYAMQTFEPERALPGDPFTPIGFALLGKPLLIQDAPWTPEEPGRSPTGLLPVRALSWCSLHNEDYSRGSFWISFYIDWQDEEAVYAASLDPRGDMDVWRANAQILREGGFPTLQLAHQFQWSWGDMPWREYDYLEIAVRPGDTQEAIVQRSRAQSCLIQTFWRIASQFRPAKERAPRGIWRDSNRKGVKGREVTVIRLRRSRETHDVEPGGRQLTVQFPVRGHWRNQWYPSIKEHRQVWIAPYIKGPEDAPFVMHPRAWEFVR